MSDRDCHDWIEFNTTSTNEPILFGSSHVEHIYSDAQDGSEAWEGFALRRFDPVELVWRIWWASTKNLGKLDAPLVGRFVDGVGLFIGDDTVGGREIKVRFEWSHPTPDSAAWSQAFSYDNGESWETNWTMNFTRQR
jgi:hypothetical protein